MLLRKIIAVVLTLMLLLSAVGCGTIDIMKSLNTDEEKEDFAIIDDDLDGSEQGTSEVNITFNTDAELRDSVAYFEDNNGFIIPVKTKIPWEEGIAKAVFKQLIVGSELDTQLSGVGLHGVIPEGTKILGMSINEGLCKIDVSNDFLNTKSFEAEKNMISSITYTMTEFSTIDSVGFMVEGENMLSLSNGYSIDAAFERENINLFGREDGSNYTVYYKSNDVETAGMYVPITFTAEIVDNPINIVLKKLFGGPPADLPMTNEIPYGVDYQGLVVEDGKVLIDLSMGALNLSQVEYDDMTRMVTLCLDQFDNVNDCSFLIEGMTFDEAGMELEDNDMVPVFNEY